MIEAKNQAIRDAIDVFDLESARALVRAARPSANAETWYLASLVAIHERQRLDFLDKALVLDPGHVAARAEHARLTQSSANASSVTSATVRLKQPLNSPVTSATILLEPPRESVQETKAAPPVTRDVASVELVTAPRQHPALAQPIMRDNQPATPPSRTALAQPLMRDDGPRELSEKEMFGDEPSDVQRAYMIIGIVSLGFGAAVAASSTVTPLFYGAIAGGGFFGFLWLLIKIGNRNETSDGEYERTSPAKQKRERAPLTPEQQAKKQQQAQAAVAATVVMGGAAAWWYHKRSSQRAHHRHAHRRPQPGLIQITNALQALPSRVQQPQQPAPPAYQQPSPSYPAPSTNQQPSPPYQQPSQSYSSSPQYDAPEPSAYAKRIAELNIAQFDADRVREQQERTEAAQRAADEAAYRQQQEQMRRMEDDRRRNDGW